MIMSEKKIMIDFVYTASWFDHGRDLLFMLNEFQDHITQPIIGVGHSMGGMQL